MVTKSRDCHHDEGAKSTSESMALGLQRQASATPEQRAPDFTSAGNFAVQRMLRRQGIQAMLTVNAPGDEYEQEADQVAEQVMEPRGGPSKGPPTIQRMCSECEEELHSKPLLSSEPLAGGQELGPAAESKVEAARGAGQGLSSSARSFFEPRFGRSLDHVRVHSDSRAAEAARSINARAYTQGRDIVFGAGEYQPDTESGKRLLAHEVTHTIQQAGNGGTGAGLQRTIGDGHDLASPRFSGDAVLEGCFDVGDRVFLRRGSRGTAVATIQHALVEGGFLLPNFGVDGVFGAETEAAVRAFQTSRGVGSDGVIGPITMGEFDLAFPTAPAAGPAPIPNTPAPSGRAPALTGTITTGPTPGNCGGMLFIVRWDLSANAGALGGFVIQDITFTWRVVDCAGVVVPNPDPRTSPLRYFEAWRVAPNSRSLSPEIDDRFFWPSGPPWAGTCTNGTVDIVATARFHNNVLDIPGHMTAFNGATFANNLRSSTSDPNVGGDTSPSIAHALRFHWTCCPCSVTPTVVDSHTP